MTKRLLPSLFLLPAVFATTASVKAQNSVGENCAVAPAPAAPAAAAPVADYGWQGYAMQSGPKHPHFPPFGCGGYCIGFLSRIHFHGPLYNYGPYYGYYPFEPYGPWGSDLRYHGPRPGEGGGCGWLGGLGGLGLGWGHYSIATLKNVFHRVNPLAHKCGSSLHLGSCGSHGSSCTASTCGAGGCSAGVGQPVSTTVTVQPAPAVTTAPVAAEPRPMLPSVLTGLPK